MGWLKNVVTWDKPEAVPELAKANRIYNRKRHSDNLTDEEVAEIERLMEQRERKKR